MLLGILKRAPRMPSAAAAEGAAAAAGSPNEARDGQDLLLPPANGNVTANGGGDDPMTPSPLVSTLVPVPRNHGAKGEVRVCM